MSHIDADASDNSVFGVVSSGEPAAGERPRLAAIVFTDVVGYSSRMGADEKATIQAVHDDFTNMREKVERHGGEVLNTMGDGMMLAFGGAVAAMQFAKEMQTEFAIRNTKVSPKMALQHRVGVHIGDVYRVQGGHMAGDGVNIAARLEPRAAPGGIAISQMVYDTVKNKVTLKAERMGPQTFKNIAEAIVVWRVSPDIEEAPVTRPITLGNEKPAGSSWVKKLVWTCVILAAVNFLWPYKDQALASAQKMWASTTGTMGALTK